MWVFLTQRDEIGAFADDDFAAFCFQIEKGGEIFFGRDSPDIEQDGAREIVIGGKRFAVGLEKLGIDAS